MEAFEEHSTYSSAIFLEHVVQFFKLPIECVQTDNGFDFTNRFSNTKRDYKRYLKATAQKLSICHKLIRSYTPRHNSKVERSNRKDQKCFYSKARFYSFVDFQLHVD